MKQSQGRRRRESVVHHISGDRRTINAGQQQKHGLHQPNANASEQTKNMEVLPPHYPPTPPSLLFVLSGPSGVGKDAVINRLKEKCCPWHFTVTVTTRPPRPGEIHGQSYFFATQEEFEQMKQRDELLEWAFVHGYYYGTPIKQVREALRNGKDVFLKIDVQGAAQIKRRIPDAVFIFLGPEKVESLYARLAQRGTESPEQMATRLRNAYEEMKHLPVPCAREDVPLGVADHRAGAQLLQQS